MLTACTEPNYTESERNSKKSTSNAEVRFTTEYGVYIGVEFDELPEDISCDVLVIDAQYYTSEELDQLHAGDVLRQEGDEARDLRPDDTVYLPDEDAEAQGHAEDHRQEKEG